MEEEGRSIARELGVGVRYFDTQYYNDEFVFHLFHDDAVTGSSFAAKTRGEAKKVLPQERKGLRKGKCKQRNFSVAGSTYSPSYYLRRALLGETEVLGSLTLFPLV
ncbi:hypothetical protein ES703_62521 [subsurface metagenome]